MTSCVVRCLAFGLPVPHSPRSGQFCVLLCNSVTVPVSPTLRFAARSPSSQRAGLDSGCAGKKTYPWVGDYFLGALKSHLATRAFSPFATTISPSACPIHAAADLMAPSSRQGQRALAAHGRSISAAVFCLPCGCLTTVAPTTLAMQALLLHDPGLSWHRCRCAGGLLFSALALPHRAV